MRRDAFSECGGYCEALPSMQDHHLWMKFLRKGYQLSMLPKVMISYRITANAISNWEKSEELLRLFEKILEYDNPPKDLLDSYRLEVERGKGLTDSQSQRVALIQNTLHCKISRISKKLHVEWIAEQVVCSLQNIIS